MGGWRSAFTRTKRCFFLYFRASAAGPHRDDAAGVVLDARDAQRAERERDPGGVSAHPRAAPARLPVLRPGQPQEVPPQVQDVRNCSVSCEFLQQARSKRPILFCKGQFCLDFCVGVVAESSKWSECNTSLFSRLLFQKPLK